MRVLSAILIVVLLSFSTAVAEDLNVIFKKVNELVASNNYPKAMEELEWARKEIEKLHLTKLKGFLPESVAGFKGGEIESSAALGFTNLERKYVSGQNSVKVSLTGTGSKSGGLGGLAAMGRMAAMMGNQPGTETFRIEGKTASVTSKKGNNSELSVFLESGSILKVESRSADSDTLKKIAQSLKINDLDNYLRGMS